MTSSPARIAVSASWRIVPRWIDMSPGTVQRTGNPLDVAIDGKGYFTVQTARGQRYTRNGALSINATGQLVTSDGDQVMGANGPITFQPTDHDVIISSTGIISVRDGSGTTECAARTTANRRALIIRSSCKRTAVRCSWRRPGSRCRYRAAEYPHPARRRREIECAAPIC